MKIFKKTNHKNQEKDFINLKKNGNRLWQDIKLYFMLVL
jgi:hypothetical protein